MAQQPDLAELFRMAEGDPQAADQLFSVLYDELRRLAERQLRGHSHALTLGATTLVHEVYLNICSRPATTFPDRARFFAYAARAMRGLVIDYARKRQAIKRGRELEITLVEELTSAAAVTMTSCELESLGDALTELTAVDPALAELVDLHFFAGFTFADIATLRGVSERTVQRDWRKARLLLHHILTDDASGRAGSMLSSSDRAAPTRESSDP